MELKRIEELISELPAEQRKAILSIIDLKIEQDMKEVIKSNEMIRESVNNSIKHLENKFDNKTNAIESQIRMLFWALGIIITLIIALKMFG